MDGRGDRLEAGTEVGRREIIRAWARVMTVGTEKRGTETAGFEK